MQFVQHQQHRCALHMRCSRDVGLPSACWTEFAKYRFQKLLCLHCAIFIYLNLSHVWCWKLVLGWGRMWSCWILLGCQIDFQIKLWLIEKTNQKKFLAFWSQDKLAAYFVDSWYCQLPSATSHKLHTGESGFKIQWIDVKRTVSVSSFTSRVSRFNFFCVLRGKKLCIRCELLLCVKQKRNCFFRLPGR